MKKYLVLFILLVVPASLFAQKEINIGVPKIADKFNLFESEDALSFTLAGMALGYLWKQHADSFKFGIARSFEVSADYRSVFIDIDSKIRFNNGAQVRPIDVLFSVERCQLSSTVLSGWKFLMDQSGRVQAESALGENNVQEFLAQISTCPILEKQSSLVFGESLGYGTNLVSAAPFSIVEFKRERSYMLERVLPHGEVLSESPSVIFLRSYPNSDKALSALRLGNLDLFFTYNQEVIERAEKDETLFASKCSIYSVVQRKGLKFSCDPYLDPMTLRY